MDNATATFAEFAALLGCKRSYVTELKKAGRLVLTAEGRVDVAASRARIEATRDPSKAGVAARHAAARTPHTDEAAARAESAAAPAREDPAPGAPSDDAAASQGYQHWRERSERARAIAGERENAVAEGRLLDATDVERNLAAAITALRSRLEALPDTLGPQVAAIADEDRVRALLAGEIEHALEECARMFAAAGRKAEASHA